jgi:hypothetical protein
LVHFRYGETLLALGDSHQALNQFQWLQIHKTGTPALNSLSRLRIAQCLDLLGSRAEAIASYRGLLEGAVEADVKDEARRGMLRPFRLEKTSK